MKSRKIQQINDRFDEIHAEIDALALRVQRLADFTVRVDERVEEIEEQMRDAKAPDAWAAGLQRSVERVRRQTAELRRESRSRIASLRLD